MLTWINEKAKWIVAFAAVLIGVGLLAMDKVPDQATRYPLGKVNGRKIYMEDYAARLKQATEAQRGNSLSDEQYAGIRNEIFRSFVRQYVLEEQVEKNGLSASVAEMRAELLTNPNMVRNLVGQEAQQNLYAIQANATSAEEANQRIQLYLSRLPSFLMDTTFDQADYERWLSTPEAYEWASMVNYEKELKSTIIPMKQLQTFVSAGLHTTSLEARYMASRRKNELELQVASVAASSFASPEVAIDSNAVLAYFKSQPDSFYVREDLMKVQYAAIPIVASEKDDANLREYAMTLYGQLMDSSVTFAELARISSEDPSSAEQGGLLGDYTARGVWVKPFEEAAFALDSGAISEPVRTEFGYHIIQSLGKVVDSLGSEQVRAAHILVTVTASSQTEDSLSRILEKVKGDVESGKSFEQAVQAAGLSVHAGEWIARGGELSETGYLPGLASYLFANSNLNESRSSVSDVLKNHRFVALAYKADSLVAGTRRVEPYFEEITAKLKEKASVAKAKEYLESVSKEVVAWNAGDSILPEIENVSFSNERASLEGYVAGIGYANPLFSKIASAQKVGEWGPVWETDAGAVLVKINGERKASEEVLDGAARDELVNDYRFGASSVVADYVVSLETSADVENNLDLYYRE